LQSSGRIHGGGSQVARSPTVRRDLLAFGALLFWTAYWLVSKRSRRHVDALEYTTGATITAAIAVTLVLVITGEHLGRSMGRLVLDRAARRRAG